MNEYTILKYPWQTAHDYELAKIPHRFLYLDNTYRQWASSNRPIPSNIEWVTATDAEASDVMVLHLDQWSFHEPAKRFLFLRNKASYRGPKIVIIHGCNLVDGCTSKQMAELVEGCHVVCNSETAYRLWDLPNSRFIRHGMSPEEWPSTDYSQNNIVVVQPHRARHKACVNRMAIAKAEKNVEIDWIGRDLKFHSFDEYRQFLGRSTAFFNPSLASANPRARTEAMLMGLAICTTNMHGEDEYIENGINGFCSNDIEELVDFLEYLKENPDRAREMGMRGRDTAQKVFHIDRFVEQWNTLLGDVVKA